MPWTTELERVEREFIPEEAIVTAKLFRSAASEVEDMIVKCQKMQTRLDGSWTGESRDAYMPQNQEAIEKIIRYKTTLVLAAERLKKLTVTVVEFEEKRVWSSGAYDME